MARGHRGSLNTAAKSTNQTGVAAKTERKFRVTTDSNHDLPVAEDLVDRRFDPAAPDRTRAADITHIPTRVGWLCLAAVEDLHSRRIVGWPMGDRMESRLVVDASAMAVARRLPGEDLVAHSDRGGRYARERCRGRLAGRGTTCRMGRVGAAGTTRR